MDIKTKIIKEGLKRAIPSARVLVEKMLKKKKKKVSDKEKEKIIKEVQDVKNISNKEIRGAKKPLSDSAKFERSFFTEKEKKILDKYDINVVGVKPNKNMKRGGRLNDGAAFIKSLYKDKL